MQKIKLLRYLFLLCFSLGMFGLNAQVVINEDFDSGTPAGWTDSYGNTTTQPCAVGSERDNLYSGSSTGNMTSPNQVAGSNATDLTVSFDYKVVNWSAATVATPTGWGSADLQYSTDDGATWVTALTVDDANHVTANTCATMMAIIPAASLPLGADVKLQIANTWASGDYYFYIDNFSATQVVSAPPACSTNETSTPDVACGNFDVPMTWDAVIGVSGYNINVGTTAGGTDVENGTDLGNVTSYTLAAPLLGQTYYWTVIPYNGVGPATGCTEFSFTTAATGCYCPSVPSSNDGTGITDVTVGATTFPSGGDITYEDFTGAPETLSQGVQANVMITFATGFTYGTNIWIDFNDDFAFDATELVYSGVSTNANPTVLDASFIMPAAAAIGTHRMRIGTADSGQATPNSCYSGTYGVTMDLDVDIIMASCMPAAGTAVTGTCDDVASTFMIDVDITDLGDGTVNITNDAGVTATNGITAIGTTSVGPFPFGTVTITLEHPTDPLCNIVLPAISLANCPPANDDCINAIPLTVNADLACGTTTSATNVGATASTQTDDVTGTPDNDVWFSFVATGVAHTVDLTNIVPVIGTSTDMGIGLYDGTAGCGALVFTDDSDPESTTFTGLVAGTTYYLRVHGWYNSASTSYMEGTFDVCVGTVPPPPSNDDCSTPDALTESPDASCAMSISGTTLGATQSGETTLCSTFSNDDDVWYSFTPANTSTYNFELSNTSTGTYVHIYSGTCAGGLTTVGTCFSTATNSAALTAATTYLVQVHTSASSGGTTFDLCTYDANACPVPTALAFVSNTSSSVDVSWTAGGSETTWEIEVVDITAAGTPTGTATATTMVNNPYSITGLMANNDYDVYVRADCGGGLFSPWVSVSTFTLCEAEVMTCAMDYLEDFGVTGAITADCYLVAGGPATGPTGATTGGGWYFQEFANDGSGTLSAGLNMYDLGTEDWLFTPEFDLSAGGPYEMTMDIAITEWANTNAGTLGSDDQVQVLVTADAGATWTSLETWDNTSIVSSAGEPRTYDLTAYAGQTIQFGFWGTEGIVDDAEDMEFHIDNVSVGCACTSVGGIISTTDPTTVCVGDGTADNVTPVLDGSEVGTTQAWIVTDAAGIILDLPAATPIDFDGAPVGVCNIYSVSHDGTLTGLIAGNDVNADLAGCYDLSNAIAITRNAPPTASATSTNESCAGTDGTATVVAAGGTAYTYLWDDAAAQTTDVATGLTAGMYNVVVTETTTGCTVMATATVVADACDTVTFNVDMNCPDPAGAFTSVGITGPFCGWCNDIVLADPDMDGIYSITLSFPVGTVLEYKYMTDMFAGQEDLVDDANSGGACAVVTDNATFANRQVTLANGATYDDVYGTCGTCADGCTDPNAVNYDAAAANNDGSCEYAVTFNVDMNCPDPVGAFSTVHMTGPFCGWCGAGSGYDMTDPDMDGIYSITINLPAGPFEYKYMVDNFASQEDLIGDACAPITDGSTFANREFTVVSSLAQMSDDVYGGCTPCTTADPCVDGYETANQLTGPLMMNADYETDQSIDSDQVLSGAIGVDYDAAIDIDLLPGFEVQLGVEFDAFIDGCQGGTDDGAGGNQ